MMLFEVLTIRIYPSSSASFHMEYIQLFYLVAIIFFFFIFLTTFFCLKIQKSPLLPFLFLHLQIHFPYSIHFFLHLLHLCRGHVCFALSTHFALQSSFFFYLILHTNLPLPL